MPAYENLCGNCFRPAPNPNMPCPRCGFEPSWNQRFNCALPVGSILAGRYIVGRVLGQGGFGITYVAYDRPNNRIVAIKEYFPQSLMGRRTNGYSVSVSNGENVPLYKDGMKSFIGEARILSKFASHPNIVTVYECFTENTTAYYVMDYVRGRNLKSHVKSSGGKIPWREALNYIIPTADALMAVHRKGLIHRDVTPDNIYIVGGGGVRLLDFGAARFSLGNKTQTLDVLIKPGYAPREQYMQKSRQGPYTDVYSLAATFYSIVSGYVPPDALERAMNDKIIPLHVLCPDIPPALEAVIHKALSVNYENRYKSMGEFKAALTDALGSSLSQPVYAPSSPSSPQPQGSAQADNRLKPLGITTVVLLLLFLAMLIASVASEVWLAPAVLIGVWAMVSLLGWIVVYVKNKG